MGLPGPDPFVRGTDPDTAPDPYLFPEMSWADEIMLDKIENTKF